MANLVQIEKYLRYKKLPYKVIDLGTEIFTVKGVVEAGVDEEEIVKTLVVKLQNTQRSQHKMQFVALAVRGKDRVDFKKVRKLFGLSTSLGVNCELAKADEVKKVVGVPIGAVCPILLKIPIYIDRKVMDLNTVNLGSGDLKKGLEMKLADLLEAIGKYQVEGFALA